MNMVVLGAHLLTEIDRLDCEARNVYRELVLPNWGKVLHGFPDTLYGYMMGVFARIDLASAYWKGGKKDQTSRMVSFMDQYLSSDHEANSVAIQIWRHKLMHTSQPRYLTDQTTHRTYRWLLLWWEHLPKEQHYCFADTSDSRILNLGLIYLIADVRRAFEGYLRDLSCTSELERHFQTVESQLSSNKFRC